MSAPRVEAMRARIRDHAALNAFISETTEEGDGTVVAVKDLIDVIGVPTTAGSDILPMTPARADAPVVTRIRRAGCIVIGKTNLHEWAAGPTSAASRFGPVRNPHDPERVSGGSSGGSAVAVALDMCDWAIGTDTGGSVRIPAALCGVVGLKPTYGLVDNDSVIPLCQSLDTLGPIARTVQGALDALDMMLGAEVSAPAAPPEWSRLRIAVPGGWVTDIDGPTAAVWDELSRGLPVIDFPDRGRFARTILPILQGEAADNHRERLGEHASSYAKDTRAFIEAGLYVTAADYLAAKRDSAALRRESDFAMRGWDALLLPTTAIVAPRIGEANVREPLTRFTRPFNVTGHPAISIPVPNAGALPVGVQVVGHMHGDRELGAVALALERHLGGSPSRT